MERRIDRYGGAWLDWEPAEILQDGGDVMGVLVLIWAARFWSSWS